MVEIKIRISPTGWIEVSCIDPMKMGLCVNLDGDLDKEKSMMILWEYLRQMVYQFT